MQSTSQRLLGAKVQRWKTTRRLMHCQCHGNKKSALKKIFFSARSYLYGQKASAVSNVIKGEQCLPDLPSNPNHRSRGASGFELSFLTRFQKSP